MAMSKLVEGLYEQAELIGEQLAKENVNSVTYRSLAETLYYISHSACEVHSLECCVKGVSVQTAQDKLAEVHKKEEAKKEKPKKAEPKKEEPTPVAEEPYVAPEDTEQFEHPVSEEVKPETVYTVEDIRNATKKALAEKRLTDPKGFFERFGVSKASDVPVERYAEFMEALKNL